MVNWLSPEGSEFFCSPPRPDQLSDPPQPRQQSITGESRWTVRLPVNLYLAPP